MTFTESGELRCCMAVAHMTDGAVLVLPGPAIRCYLLRRHRCECTRHRRTSPVRSCHDRMMALDNGVPVIWELLC